MNAVYPMRANYRLTGDGYRGDLGKSVPWNNLLTFECFGEILDAEKIPQHNKERNDEQNVYSEAVLADSPLLCFNLNQHVG